MSAEKREIICATNICKRFSSNNVLKGVDFRVCSGDIVSLVGGNGAGKSTLVKIIMGIYKADCGDISYCEQPVNISKPTDALDLGIYLVPQEPMLFPNMTVEENILIGFKEKETVLKEKLIQIIDTIGWDISLTRKAQTLSIAEQQMVEIMRGLLRQAQLLILDEPTSALSFEEVSSLFKIVKDLQSRGIGIVYITHRLDEVLEISTHVAIMRDGYITKYGDIDEFTKKSLIDALLPPDSDLANSWKIKDDIDYSKAKPVLELKDFSGYGFADVNLTVYEGEILGIAGLIGAGRTEMVGTVFGKDKSKSGYVYLSGEDITGLSTSNVIKKGINYVAEDRFLHGVFGIKDVLTNISPSYLNMIGGFFVNRNSENELADKYIKDFNIKVTDKSQMMSSLSGGNQQKAIIGRALSTSPKLIILDEPTRGIDAAARGDVYQIIHQLKQSGVAIILVSSDMEEIIELSDRAFTMHRGRINKEFLKDQITQDNLTQASFGILQ